MNIFLYIKIKIVLIIKGTDITAFILSGGNSSRMRTNKSFLVIDGKPLIQRLTELLDSIFPVVMISSNEPKLYEFLGKKIIKDIFPNRGPLSGIHSALNFTTSNRNFIISCDMPFISSELIKYIIDFKSDSEVMLPGYEARIQQLCGIYLKSVLPIVENLLVESGEQNSRLEGSIFELLDRVTAEFISVDKLNFYHQNLFLNINTLEDYHLAKSILERK